MTLAQEVAAPRGKLYRVLLIGSVVDLLLAQDSQKQFVVAAAIDPELQETLKREVAKKAVQLIKPGMIVGIGTGSTSCMAIEELAKLINTGKVRHFSLE